MSIFCSYAIVIIAGLIRITLYRVDSQDKSSSLEDKYQMGQICLVECDIL